jgi:tRNA-dihydrouridine synthase C
VLPNRTFLRTCPELLHDSRTDAGTPMRVQLLGSDPHFMAANARRLVKHRPAGVDINFGCPAPTVFRHRGGSALLGEPDLLHAIVSAVRAEVPADIPFTAKMRLGIADSSLAVDCAQAIEAGGVDELIVHGRTKVDGYKPPARWAQIDRVRAAVGIPIIANGEVWTVADSASASRNRAVPTSCSGGALADPLLPRKVRGEAAGGWPELARGGDLLVRRARAGHAGACRRPPQAVADAAAPPLPAGRGALPALRPVKAAEDIDRLLLAPASPIACCWQLTAIRWKAIPVSSAAPRRPARGSGGAGRRHLAHPFRKPILDYNRQAFRRRWRRATPGTRRRRSSSMPAVAWAGARCAWLNAIPIISYRGRSVE